MLIIIKRILAPLAPSLICLGILRYQQKKYKAARKNLIRGISLSRSATYTDLLDETYLLLTEFRLGDFSKLEEVKEISSKLKKYSQERTDSYWYAIEEINKIVFS